MIIIYKRRHKRNGGGEKRKKTPTKKNIKKNKTLYYYSTIVFNRTGFSLSLSLSFCVPKIAERTRVRGEGDLLWSDNNWIWG